MGNGLTYNTISWIITNTGRTLSNSNKSDSEPGLEAPSPA